MEYFKSGLKTVLGAAEPGDLPTGAETVERLVDRISTSTLLEDRRDACRALKALSRKYRLEVGAQGMTPLVQVLELDRADSEIVGYALDTLVNITSPRFPEEEGNPAITLNMGEQFTEIFIKNPENVSLVLSYIEEYDFRIRWPAVKLLTCLSTHRPRELQDIILISPMGVSKLMDVIGDSREVIRNDMITLLIHLTNDNSNIQKIVAFENAFDRLFDIITNEGCADGGIVVEDCLIVMLNLLENNTSNQQFFKEGSYIQKLSPMLVIDTDDAWSEQKSRNIDYMLEIVCALVSPSNQTQVCTSCQNAMNSCDLLQNLCAILMAGGVPVNILANTITTIAEVIRGNFTNQEYFGHLQAPSSPPSSAIVILLMSLVNDKQPFTLRTAILYCFQCYLFRHEIGQAEVVQTLLPKEPTVSGCTSGQLLCNGLLSDSPLSVWFSSVALMHCTLENPALKEELLQVSLAPNLNSPQISLLNQCMVLIQKGPNSVVQGKIGLLMLLCSWLSHSTKAVNALISHPSSVSYLIAQVSANEQHDDEYLMKGICALLIGICILYNDDTNSDYNRENLCKLIVNRIGVETYVAKLSKFSRHEMYSLAAKQPAIKATKHRELLLDYEFCELFKALEALIVKTITSFGDGTNNLNLSEMSLSEQESALLCKYKNIIRDQDMQMMQLRTQAQQLSNQNSAIQKQLEEVMITNNQLKDQNTLLKAQLASGSSNPNSIATGENQELQTVTDLDNGSKSREDSLKEEIEKLKVQLSEVNFLLTEKTKSYEALTKDQEDLLELLTDQDAKLIEYKNHMMTCTFTKSNAEQQVEN